MQIPGGSWLLAGIPLHGWQQPSPNQAWILIVGCFLAVTGSTIIFIWQHHEFIIKNQTRTALDQAERYLVELDENKNFLNAILENIPDAIFVKDAKHLKFVLVNKAGETSLGIPSQQLIGKSNFDFFQHQDAQKFTQTDRQVLAEKTLIDIPEESIFTPNLGTRILHTKKIPLLNKQGEATHLVGIAEDITEIKHAAQEKQILEKQLQQAQKMEAIGLMAGGVAHDLNNILAAITGYPELILKKLPQDSELRTPLRVIRDAGRRAAAVVADLLTVARGAASSRIAVNLNALIHEYLESPEFKKLTTSYPGVEVKIDLDPNLQTISASPIHIKKILMNLLNNAAEAIESVGVITINTSFTHIDKQEDVNQLTVPGDYNLLRISDSGTGIAKEDLEHIFEPFYTKKSLGRSGTGLGLAVVWNTVHEHNGSIFVDSSSKGSTFYLYFPIVEVTQEPEEDAQHTNDLNGNGEHILVIDDESHMRDIACQMLESCSYQTSTAKSGEQAIAAVKRAKPDLILIDMLMPPGMNGRETYAEIIKMNPDQKAIIVSGFSESEEVKATLNLGANCFIDKPYSLKQLAKTVKDTLSA